MCRDQAQRFGELTCQDGCPLYGGLIMTQLFLNVDHDLSREPLMCRDADLTAVVYDPPAPDLPHMAVLFDAGGKVVAVRPVESIDAGEAALANLVEHLTAEQQQTA